MFRPASEHQNKTKETQLWLVKVALIVTTIASLCLFIFPTEDRDLVIGVGPVVYHYDPLHCQLRRFLFCRLKQNEAVRSQWGREGDGGRNMRKLLIISDVSLLSPNVLTTQPMSLYLFLIAVPPSSSPGHFLSYKSSLVTNNSPSS